MRRIKSKVNYLNVVGVWSGQEDEVTAWLTDNGYVWRIQTGAKQAKWLKEMAEEMEGGEVRNESDRLNLHILGEGLYELWQLAPGMALVVDDEGELHTWGTDNLARHFEDV